MRECKATGTAGRGSRAGRRLGKCNAQSIKGTDDISLEKDEKNFGRRVGQGQGQGGQGQGKRRGMGNGRGLGK